MRLLSGRVTIANTLTARPPKKTADPFYQSAAWVGLVADVVAQRGQRCEDPKCSKPGRVGIRVVGDHIVELKDGGAPLDPQNVMLRCWSCHTRKSNEARAARIAEPLRPPGGESLGDACSPDRRGAHAEILEGPGRVGNRRGPESDLA